MKLENALSNLQDASERYEAVADDAAKPLASLDYAAYAQAAYELRHAREVVEAAIEKNATAAQRVPMRRRG
ncbi:hypothetical protein RBI13_02080 [Alcaligenaceae bacterium A4P071]|nr:hypothetical protein [Alcaligenaceae bacterium C4P045]MDQ2183969.1 hypothetical protein [Alcaligenaceae bacterium A4P071]